jgi:hypothetical protein
MELARLLIAFWAIQESAGGMGYIWLELSEGSFSMYQLAIYLFWVLNF